MALDRVLNILFTFIFSYFQTHTEPQSGSLFIHFYTAIYAVVTRQLSVFERQYRALFLAGWPSLLTDDESAIALSIMPSRPNTGLVEFSKKNYKKSIYTYFIYTYTLRFTCINTCVCVYMHCKGKTKKGKMHLNEYLSICLVWQPCTLHPGVTFSLCRLGVTERC